jgi:hypothetical protein
MVKGKKVPEKEWARKGRARRLGVAIVEAELLSDSRAQGASSATRTEGASSATRPARESAATRDHGRLPRAPHLAPSLMLLPRLEWPTEWQ